MTGALAVRRSLGDRLNPILVKEVRQALRGRYFRGLFWLTLGVATLTGLFVVAEAASREAVERVGGLFFMWMFACMSAAVHCFTPFSAFLSTSAEHDENTHDLLVLSNLRPRQIVSGKLLSALIQALLYYSTFGPFLVFAYLLNGVDLLVIGVTLGSSVVLCVALSLAGIALASLTAARALRIVLMAMFGAGLVAVWGMTMGMAYEMVEQPQMLRSSDTLLGFGSFALAMVVAAALFGAVAGSRLAHAEENRSSRLRLFATLTVLISGAWSVGMVHWQHDRKFALAGAVLSILVVGLIWLFAITEPRELGRRVAAHAPRSTPLALLAAPWLPGHGRGALLMAIHSALIMAGVEISLRLSSASEFQIDQMRAASAGLLAYAWIYLALPTAFAMWFVRTARGRMALRVAVVAAIPFALLLPALFGLLLGIRSWTEFMHPFNPGWVLLETLDRDHVDVRHLGLLWLAWAGVLAVNAPRMLMGLIEVARAARARQAPDVSAAAPEPR